jgi:hypothetical protein
MYLELNSRHNHAVHLEKYFAIEFNDRCIVVILNSPNEIKAAKQNNNPPFPMLRLGLFDGCGLAHWKHSSILLRDSMIDEVLLVYLYSGYAF